MQRVLDFPDIQDIRNFAVKLVTEKLPAAEGSGWLEQEVCQGRLRSRGHVAAPELCHWLLWKIGCRDSRVLSRDIPELNIVWTPNSLQKIVQGAQRVAAWTRWDLDRTPQPGDILSLGKPSWGEIEHVCVFLRSDSRSWTTADILPCERKGHIQATMVTREIRGVTMMGNTGRTKQINGWLCLEKLALDVAPDSTP